MNIPTGTVTFLFTDIEGSTRLSQDFPDTIQSLLEKHNSILHKAVRSNNGFVFEIVGDAFCCSFENAGDAINAAIDAQLNLTKEKCLPAGEAGRDAVIKIRIGIHYGNADWNGTKYTGYLTLAKTARIMSAAYGEQIIISNDVYELTKDSLCVRGSNEISFRDLGERRLKDVTQPVRLFQIISKELRKDFPPLKTLDARPNNLPVQLTSFIGREEEMKRLKDLLKQTHLLTLTGSGGAGKTRLALQVAADVIDDFANGVRIVELASIPDPAFLSRVVMKVLDIKEEPQRTQEEALCDHLKDKQILIIFDNCEHLIDACAKLTEKLLNNCPKLKIIATSREALRCNGEQTHRVLPLSHPDLTEEISAEKLKQYEAVSLFIDRALAVDPDFRVNNDNAPALAQICFQLDGIPLAIELAAARIKVISVEKMYERLSDRFKLLTGGKRTALPRQQTLKALIDWSYDLLSEKEKILWQRLTVFAGGWTLDSAEKICSDEIINEDELLDLLYSLTEKSIIIFENEKERYNLPETIKQYGAEKLKASNEFETIKNKHTVFFMKFADTAEPELKDPKHDDWEQDLESEHGNLWAAQAWLNDNEGKEDGLRYKVTMKMWHTLKKSLTK